MKESRLLPVSGKDMVKVFSKIGYRIERQKGSHIVMSKGEDVLVIPNHNTVLKGHKGNRLKMQDLQLKNLNLF